MTSFLTTFSAFGAAVSYSTIFRLFRSQILVVTCTDFFVIVQRVAHWPSCHGHLQSSAWRSCSLLPFKPYSAGLLQCLQPLSSQAGRNIMSSSVSYRLFLSYRQWGLCFFYCYPYFTFTSQGMPRRRRLIRLPVQRDGPLWSRLLFCLVLASWSSWPICW